MFAKFVEAVSKPVEQIARTAGKQIEREFQREADRAAARLSARAVKESSRRIAGLFSAIAPEDADPGPAATTGGGLMAGALFAPPDDAA